MVDAPAAAADTVGAGAGTPSQQLVKLAGGNERLCGVAAPHQAPPDVHIRHGALPGGLLQLLVDLLTEQTEGKGKREKLETDRLSVGMSGGRRGSPSPYPVVTQVAQIQAFPCWAACRSARQRCAG